MCNGLSEEITIGGKKKKICNKIFFFFLLLLEWNSTSGPETGEYFTRWQWQCEGMNWGHVEHENEYLHTCTIHKHG